MKAMRAKIMGIAVVGALALSGCATSGGGGGRAAPAQVTRFHLGQPIAPGNVMIEQRGQGAISPLEFKTYADAVAPELTRLGFTVTPTLTTSELVAVVDVRRGTREQMAQRSPLTVGLGGGSYGGGVGLGVGTSFGVGKKRGGTIVVTELSVQLKRRSEGTVIWEGRASTEATAGAPGSEPGPAVAYLANVLFRDFPGESGRTIIVK
ncbi:DUF4136 domain-containing protein [Sphingomonas sp. ID0503]|uniref:DUF4136 domain-containing protein n=1 Tax=Sphingomonas sp. ID0503 TaxID=3399691 RepID=UPI003AFB6F35